MYTTVSSLRRACPIQRSLSFAKRVDGRFTPRRSSATVYDRWKSCGRRITRLARRRKYPSRHRCSRLPNEQCCKPYSSDAITAEPTNFPFNRLFTARRRNTRGFNRFTIVSAQHMRCFTAASELPSST